MGLTVDRRGFLKSILAAGVAPYVVTSAGVLMPVKKILAASAEEVAFLQSGTGAVTKTLKDALRLWGDGIHDDTVALQAWIEGRPVLDMRGALLGRVLCGGEYRVSQTIYMKPDYPVRELLGNIFHGPVTDEGPMFHYTPRISDDVPPFSAVTFKNVDWRQK